MVQLADVECRKVLAGCRGSGFWEPVRTAWLEHDQKGKTPYLTDKERLLGPPT